MASSRPANALHSLHRPPVVHTRDRSRAHVRRTNGVRGAELCAEANRQGGAAAGYVVQSYTFNSRSVAGGNAKRMRTPGKQKAPEKKKRAHIPRIRPRTQLTQQAEMLGKGYGMPSSHAQFLSFFALYLALWLALRHKPRSEPPSRARAPFGTPAGSSPPEFPIPTFLLHGATAALFLLLATAVAASRVYLSYHTPRQVLVGSAAGAVAAAGWFAVTAWARREGWVEWVLEWKVSRWVRLREGGGEEDIRECGGRWWDRRRDERRKGKGKLS